MATKARTEKKQNAQSKNWEIIPNKQTHCKFLETKLRWIWKVLFFFSFFNFYNHFESKEKGTQDRAGPIVNCLGQTVNTENGSIYLHFSPHYTGHQHRIDFKTLLITFKACHSLAPLYFKAFLTPQEPCCCLCSSGSNLQHALTAHLVLKGERAFSVRVPQLQLPEVNLMFSGSYLIFFIIIIFYIPWCPGTCSLGGIHNWRVFGVLWQGHWFLQALSLDLL